MEDRSFVKKMKVGFWGRLIVIVCVWAYATAGVLPRLVKCRSPLFPLCRLPLLCPLACPRTCLMDCALCRPVCNCNVPSAVCEDPRFIGGDGITFYFHGRKDEDFCLVSDSNLHINVHFIGKRNPNLKRDFTWVQSIGVMFDSHKILVAAQKTSTWDQKVDHLVISVDDKPVSLPTVADSKWDSNNTVNELSISRTSDTNGVVIEVVDKLRITTHVVPITSQESKVYGYDINDDDCFAHLEVSFKFYNLSDVVDGVLGQTHSSTYESKIKLSAVMPVMGGTYKYKTSSIFDPNCAVSRFHSSPVLMENVGRKLTLEEFKCNGGREGKGLVCKR
ncbi:uncharacterized protein LOC142536726 [Primulina tabacum]|uniref:uncharacterized protein LOC142536726 n=1 Tax=Primulina tabacum TaxID=48773 RepID=UPI003F59C9FC